MNKLMKVLGTGVMILATANVANAGVIKIYNKGQTGVAGSILTVNNNDNGSSAGFIPTNIKLGIYSIVGSDKLGLQSLPPDNSGLDFYLDVVGGAPLTTTDKLRFEVTNNTNLTKVEAYDLSNPETKYDIPLNNGAGSFFDVVLPSLVSQPTGVYDTWRLNINPAESNPVPEPSTAALIGAGVLAYGASRRRGGEKKNIARIVAESNARSCGNCGYNCR